MENIKYQETNGIPICPYCQKPTTRSGGVGTSTLAYYPPQYDETGKNINPNKNIHIRNWRCEECGKDFQTRGNYVNGFDYGRQGSKNILPAIP